MLLKTSAFLSLHCTEELASQRDARSDVFHAESQKGPQQAISIWEQVVSVSEAQVVSVSEAQVVAAELCLRSSSLYRLSYSAMWSPNSFQPTSLTKLQQYVVLHVEVSASEAQAVVEEWFQKLAVNYSDLV